MSASISDRMEQILDRFDDTWNGPTPPRIEDYLTEAAADQRLPLLIELVRIDLERRLAAGEKARLDETYLRRFPELFAEPPALVTLVKHEYELRRRNEPDLLPAEYVERFPQCQTELLAQLPTLDEIRDGSRQEGAEFTLAASAATELDLRGYELMEALGKGGMGEVYRCVDPSLGRDLAIKVMKETHRAYPEIESRFLREARVTASLQHPGIVPVYNLGRLKDGRLHYTMRLVRGQTLAAILKEEAGKPERVPYLLSIFEKVCQAAAYAHSKQVIHRDLKPANVMVGRFGEVQVMDWGLAKLLTPGERGCVRAPEEEAGGGTRIHTEAADTPLAETRLGREMGTPAYMPPEQALGEWDSVDERADVFALGSILCEMLTGQPAYRGTESSEVFRLAKRGDVAEALQRLQQCGADAALTALCRECLSPNRDDRPRDASKVAERVSDYQASVQEMLRRAELEQAEAQVKAREDRKRRRLALVLSGAVLLVSIAGTLTSTLFAVDAHRQANAARQHAENAESERLRADENARKAEAEKRKATHARDEAKLALLKAETATEAERAAKQLAQSRLDQIEKADEMLDSIFRELEPRAEEQGGNSLRQQLSRLVERTAAQLDEVAAYDQRRAAHLQATLGRSFIAFGQVRQAEVLLRKALVISEKELGPDHSDTLTSLHYLALAMQLQGKIVEAVVLHERHLKRSETKRGADHPDTLQSRNNLAETYRIAGQFAKAIPLFKENLKLSEAKLGPQHSDTLQFRDNLALAYRFSSRYEEAIVLHQQTLHQREAKLGAMHPDTIRTRIHLAEAYHASNRSSEAIPLFEQTLKQREAKLGIDHPLTLSLRNNLALASWSADRTDEAMRLSEQTLKQYETKLGLDHPDTLQLRNNLATMYLIAGRTADAIRLHEQTLRHREAKFGLVHPDTLQSRSNLAAAYDQAGELAKSESLYRDVLKQTRKLFGAEAPATTSRMALLGLNLVHQHKYAYAESLLRDCLRIREAKQPDHWSTFNTQSALGEALLGQKKYTEAESLLLQGYQAMKKRQDKIPPTIRQLRLSEALERLVQLYEATDQRDKAAEWRKKLQETKAAQKKPKP